MRGIKADITGQRFGRLVAVAPTAQRDRGGVVWNCRCECGLHKNVEVAALRWGSTRSCGCLLIEKRRMNSWQVRILRRCALLDVSVRDLSQFFGIGKSCVHRAQTGQTYSQGRLKSEDLLQGVLKHIRQSGLIKNSAARFGLSQDDLRYWRRQDERVDSLVVQSAKAFVARKVIAISKLLRRGLPLNRACQEARVKLDRVHLWRRKYWWINDEILAAMKTRGTA